MIEVRIKNINEVRKTFSNYPKISAKYIQRAIKISLLKIERRAKEKTPVDTGALRAKWNLNLGFLRGTLAPKSEYASSVEYGTKPHWVSVDKLKGWARRHGISPFAVQHSIANKGTRKQPFLEPAVNENEVSREFEKAINKTLDEI